jgi:hypothetical protein
MTMNRVWQPANRVGEDDLDSTNLGHPGKQASMQRTRRTFGDTRRYGRLGRVGWSDDNGGCFGSSHKHR